MDYEQEAQARKGIVRDFGAGSVVLHGRERIESGAYVCDVCGKRMSLLEAMFVGWERNGRIVSDEVCESCNAWV